MSQNPRVIRDGRSLGHRAFHAYKLDEDGTGNYFETSQSKTTAPTLLLNTAVVPPKVKSGIINRIHYRLNPTNAETYTLRIWRGAAAANLQSNLYMLYESDPLRADDTDYDVAELAIPFNLNDEGLLYYSIEWTGASGNTTGFIEVSGEMFF